MDTYEQMKEVFSQDEIELIEGVSYFWTMVTGTDKREHVYKAIVERMRENETRN